MAPNNTHGTIQQAIHGFLLDRKVQGLAKGSMRFYEQKLKLFADWCSDSNLVEMQDITADQLRSFVLSIQDTHNPGGTHAAFRTIHALFYWYEEEYEPEGWKNPIRKLHAPRVPEELLDPVSMEDVESMLRTCDDTWAGARDRAILLLLVDTGIRASELVNLELNDVDLIRHSALIRKGKGGKPRFVFFERKTKRALRAYLKIRGEKDGPFFLSRYVERIAYDGLREIISRRAKRAGLDPQPSIHSFRRAFALNAIRKGVDLLTLMRLMGHTTTQVLQRYVKSTRDDLQAGHARSNPTGEL